MEIQIKYQNIILTVQGILQSEEEENAVQEEFIVDEIKCNDVDVFDDYDWEELEEISKLSLVEYKESRQTNWEIANV